MLFTMLDHHGLWAYGRGLYRMLHSTMRGQESIPYLANFIPCWDGCDI